MTVLENCIRIDAPPEKVWSVLPSLDALDRKWDAGIKGFFDGLKVYVETGRGPGHPV